MADMKEIKLDKVVLNCGVGSDPAKLEKALKLLSIVSGARPVKTLAKKRIPAFGIRPGLPIGCKVTLRGKAASDLLARLLQATKLTEEHFGPGILNFGIKEYIEIPGMTFQRDIGIIGFDVAVSLARRGFRVLAKKIKRGKIPLRHKISKAEAIAFIHKKFSAEVSK